MTRLLARRRRNTDLVPRLDALETVLREGEGRLDPAALVEGRAVLDRAGARLRLSGEHTVVALAGGTGSGKSSLFNALAGVDLSPVGVRRPTTGTPVACLWDPEGAGPLLDWLQVPERHRLEPPATPDPVAGDLSGLVLLDLPDHDSTVESHRLEVDRLVEVVDLLVWVLDPQKYADAAVHERYLRRLRQHRAVTLVVLNQVDLLGEQATEACLTDLRRLLHDDGLGEVALVATSVRTGLGVDTVHKALLDAVGRRAAAVERLTGDVDRVVAAFEADLGTADAAAGRATVGRQERARLREALALAAGVPVVEQAVEQAVRRRVAASTGWPFTRWAGRLRRDPLRRLHLEPAARSSLPPASPVARASVDVAVRAVGDSVVTGLPPRWAGAVRTAARSREADLDDALDRAMTAKPVAPPRRTWWEPPLGALQLVLALVTLAGALWLVGLFVVDWLRLPDPPTADLGALPLPTVLAVGGALAELLVAALGRTLGRLSARRAGRRAGAALRDEVSAVGEELVVAPVKAELARYAATREALRRAG
ncbi:50S ribosome-binding GTPase [Motilibacter peucedani]|uniref:50S ribosome-binding GTPase n=1 Tax=Motilibacter peucedani TaxID=598650 RepID=A0A420XTD0_9ACTN|nr:GTPase [Motilibacter peucedani]RKS80086.1 50S ribosome-binding GTPase [Motilibacter peucedani]